MTCGCRRSSNDKCRSSAAVRWRLLTAASAGFASWTHWERNGHRNFRRATCSCHSTTSVSCPAPASSCAVLRFSARLALMKAFRRRLTGTCGFESRAAGRLPASRRSCRSTGFTIRRSARKKKAQQIVNVLRLQQKTCPQLERRGGTRLDLREDFARYCLKWLKRLWRQRQLDQVKLLSRALLEEFR